MKWEMFQECGAYLKHEGCFVVGRCYYFLGCSSIELFGVKRSILLQDRYGQDNVSVVIVDFG